MSRLERKRRRRKTENRVRAAAIRMVLAVLGSGGYVYAKYFSEAAQYGIAIARGVYFTANYAAESEEFFECNVSYPGGNYDFDFEVRNYENNLLFNESGVEIPYRVSFWLGETPVDASYSVKIKDSAEEQALSVGQENAITFSGQSIAGGAAMANKYTIRIVVQENATHEPIPIYALVQTEEGSSIVKTLRGKMVLSASEASENYIESQGFVVPDEVSGSDAEEFARLQKVSMFTYEIRTVGELATGEVTEWLKLSWNPRLLELDLFDEAYLTWLDSDVKKELVDAGIAMDEKGLPTDDSGFQYILLEVMPYSAQTVGFFRGAEFNTIADIETLNAAIEAEEAAAAQVEAEAEAAEEAIAEALDAEDAE